MEASYEQLEEWIAWPLCDELEELCRAKGIAPRELKLLNVVQAMSTLRIPVIKFSELCAASKISSWNQRKTIPNRTAAAAGGKAQEGSLSESTLKFWAESSDETEEDTTDSSTTQTLSAPHTDSHTMSEQEFVPVGIPEACFGPTVHVEGEVARDRTTAPQNRGGTARQRCQSGPIDKWEAEFDRYLEIGSRLMFRGLFKEATQALERAMEIAVVRNLHHNVPQILGALIQVHWNGKDLLACAHYLHEALILSAKHNAWQSESSYSGGLACVYGHLGEVDKSIQWCHRQKEIAERHGDTATLLVAHCNLGNSATLQGELPAATAHYGEYLRLAERDGDPGRIGHALQKLGNVHFSQGAYQEAVKFYCRKAKLLASLNGWEEFASVELSIGECYKQLGKNNRALEAYIQILSTLSYEEGRLIAQLPFCNINAPSLRAVLNSITYLLLRLCAPLDVRWQKYCWDNRLTVDKEASAEAVEEQGPVMPPTTAPSGIVTCHEIISRYIAWWSDEEQKPSSPSPHGEERAGMRYSTSRITPVFPSLKNGGGEEYEEVEDAGLRISEHCPEWVAGVEELTRLRVGYFWLRQHLAKLKEVEGGELHLLTYLDCVSEFLDVLQGYGPAQ